MRLKLGVLLVLAAIAAVVAQAPEKQSPQEQAPQKLDARAVQVRLKGDWRQMDVRVPRDKQLFESFGFQWTMFIPADPPRWPPNQAWTTDHDNESTQTTGVMLLNTDVSPMWLDFRFLDGAGEFVQVGILRFEEGQPRWVLNQEWIRLDAYERAKGKVSQRPTAFEDEKGQPVGYRMEPFTFGTR